ncbi:MAG: bifunctional glutamate N-acetyltransferase/amino-acid acetyltransferase ArgJ [Phycisphaerae bacterium]
MQTRHITVPAGFVAAGVKCGIKPSGKEDLAIFACQSDASMAFLTTQNQIVGAPILYCRNTFARGYGKARAMVINAGCSNVCTGKAGLRDAQAMAARTAKHLGTEPEKVLVASTGVIGRRLPMDKVKTGIDDAAGRLSRRDDTSALRAIMTTDTREKSAVVQGRIAGKTVTMAGIAKGSGMIAPSLATMIGVINTDLKISPSLLSRALKQVVNTTFNSVTVDSDTSTSDMVAVFASGQAGNKTVKAGSKDFARFGALLDEVCGELSRAIVFDGEGATKLVRVEVTGARSDGEAEMAAKSVADSPLFKTAIHGQDPNWGRIAMALGKSAAKVTAEKLKIKIGGVTIFSGGTGRKFDLGKVEAHLGGSEVHVQADLGLGKGRFTALTCDLSREYITINADYTT